MKMILLILFLIITGETYVFCSFLLISYIICTLFGYLVQYILLQRGEKRDFLLFFIRLFLLEIFSL